MKRIVPLLFASAIAFAAGCSKSASTAAAPSAEILPAGTVAANFTALKMDGTPVKLSDYKGKVVLLDFWATWCGPCKVSMPMIEGLHQKLEGQGLVVLGICVGDEKENFDAWMKTPQVPTSYLKAYDPAGRGNDNIAAKLYKAEFIPALFLIDKEGKVAFSGSGIGAEPGLKKALGAAGFKL